jgi:hypothetical protein
MEFLLGTSRFDKTWAKDFCLHLDDDLTHEKEFEVQTRNILTCSGRFKLKLILIPFLFA